MPRERINRPDDNKGILCVAWGKYSDDEGPATVVVSVEEDRTPLDVRTAGTHPLTRDEINDLIKVLRKARSQAFGDA